MSPCLRGESLLVIDDCDAKQIDHIEAEISAATLVADLPEIGRLNQKQIALLAGLAPLNCDSGMSPGKRSIHGGRQSIRNVLYMAAITAIRWNPAIKAFAARLEKAGKPFKVIVTACLRKLLTIAHTLVKSNTPWTDTLAPAHP